MLLSQRSTTFARKILKHNPVPLSHQHQDCSHNCQHNHNIKTNQSADIKPYLHVHDHRKQRQIYEKPTKQKIENMKTFKQQGNQHFKNKRFQQAAYFYNKVIIFSDYTFPQQEKDQKQMDQILQQSNCNIGLTFIKLNQHKKSQTYLLQAIKGPSLKQIKKANYWLAKVCIQIGQFQKAQKIIKQLLLNLQQNKDQINQLQNYIKSAKLKYQQKSKNVFSQMFNK